ncbi:MAG: putative membrane protein [Anaerolineales bacterium]|nr:putative membrane protein [Anaerolineales bacterium]
MKAFKIAVPLILLLALAVPGTAYASGLADGRVVIGGTYSLESGQVLSGDLVIIGGAGTLESGSRVDGDVALIGGLLNAAGEVDGDVFALGGVVTLGPEAVIHGDLITMGAAVSRAEGAQVEGQVTEESMQNGFDLSFPGIVLPQVFTGVNAPAVHWGLSLFNPLFSFGWAILKALLMAGVAILVVMFWPERTARVARTIIAQPVAAGGLGLLTAFFGVTLIVVLAITICLSPVSLIGALVFGAAMIFGWASIGLEVGRRLALAFKREWHPATQAGLGTLLLSLVGFAVGLVPCLGFIFLALLWMVGLGAVLLTRFGGQESSGSTPATDIQAV